MTQCITKKKKKHRQSLQNRRRRHEQIPIGFETSVSIFEKFFFLIENGLPSLNLAWHCDPKRNPAPFFLLFLGCLENTFMQHAKKCGGNPPKAFANRRKKVKKSCHGNSCVLYHQFSMRPAATTRIYYLQHRDAHEPSRIPPLAAT